jgi:hypothetical protein
LSGICFLEYYGISSHPQSQCLSKGVIFVMRVVQ